MVVIGAGLSGLAVTARLLSAGREVALLERTSRAGGQVLTARADGLIVELGAEGFVARSRAVVALCQLLGIEGELIDQLTTDTYALEQNQLVLLPPGEAAKRLGFQVPPEELGRGIRSLSLGMGQLVEALTARVAGALQVHAVVSALTRQDGRLVVQLADRALEASAVVVAVPARPAAELLAPLQIEETKALAAAPLLSNVSVNLCYRREQLSLYPEGSGVLFPQRFAGVGLRALSLVEHKFAGRVTPERSLLRLFFRPVGDALTAWTDRQFADAASAAVADVLGARGEPEHSWVSRWADALPVFNAPYSAAAAAADRALQPLGVHLTGSAFHGAGIDAAVRSAEAVAARLGA